MKRGIDWQGTMDRAVTFSYNKYSQREIDIRWQIVPKLIWLVHSALNLCICALPRQHSKVTNPHIGDGLLVSQGANKAG